MQRVTITLDDDLLAEIDRLPGTVGSDPRSCPQWAGRGRIGGG
ncbi:hypothetical protein [Azospirillum brasilense]